MFLDPKSYKFAIYEHFKHNSRDALSNNMCDFGQNCHFFDFFQFLIINFEKFSYGKNVTFWVVENVKNIEKFIGCFNFSQLPVQN